MFSFNKKPKEKEKEEEEKPKKTPEQLQHEADNRAKNRTWGIGSALAALAIGNSPMGEAISNAVSPDELLTPEGVSYTSSTSPEVESEARDTDPESETVRVSLNGEESVYRKPTEE